jgi:hypothetical protein
VGCRGACTPGASEGAVKDALNRLYDDVCRDFYAVLADDSMETRQTFFDQLAANIREVKAEMRVTTPRNED